MHFLKPKRLISLFLCLAMLLSVASCGNTGNAVDSVNVSDVKVVSGDTQTLEDTSDNIEKSKIHVSDFYQYVNEEWLKENALGEMGYDYTKNQEYSNIVWERLTEIMEQANPEDFDENDPMRKMVLYYNQLNDPEQRNVLAVARIKELADQVQGTNNMNEFLKLMSDDTLSLFNDFCDVSYDLNSGGDNCPFIYPIPLLGWYQELTDEETSVMKEGYASLLMAVGYSEADSARIAGNACAVNKKIQEFYSNTTGYYTGYGDEAWEKEKCNIDLGKIITDTKYLYINSFDRPVLVFFVLDGYIDWINALFVNDNLQMLKDFYTLSVVDSLAACGTVEMLEANAVTVQKLFCDGVPEIDEDNLFPIAQIVSCDEGVLPAYYSEKYISNEQIEMFNELAKDVVDSYVEVIKGIEWLDIKQRERLNVKVKKTTFCLGHIEDYNHLEDVEIQDNVVDTTIEILKSNRRFNQQCLIEGNRIVPGTFNMYYPNAIYYSKENAVVIAGGYFANGSLWEESSYEERLASIGRVIAHELGHGFDSSRVGLKTNGVYDSNWDNFWEPYYESFDPVYNYYDGMETQNGNHLSGGMVCNESYADILAVKVLMNVLSKREAVDYEAFFTEYASDQAEIMNAKYEAFSIRQDTHATARERINGVLAQYDEFYDTFDIDEKSEFYLAPEKRIRMLELAQ